nr:MAG TPA: hypothetical protein [Caudoviricetes sp.]
MHASVDTYPLYIGIRGILLYITKARWFSE